MAALVAQSVAGGEIWNGFRAEPRRAREFVRGFLWLEAEQFTSYGGWVVDTQFVGQMGSAYLLAPGVGIPVAKPAETTVAIPRAGKWTAWVRTRDWIPEHSPGRFRLELGGRDSAELGGTGRPGWCWQNAGAYDLPAGETEVRLRDLSGWFARCDAILLTDDPKFVPPDDAAGVSTLRRKCAGLPAETDGGAFDVVVVGAGPGGSTAAIASARAGAKTLLVHDRPVVGGNASSEIRMSQSGPHTCGKARGPIGIDAEMLALATNGVDYTGAYGILMAREPNLTVIGNKRVTAAAKDGEVISSVLAVDTLDGTALRYRGKMFVDATGDGWLGKFAGARLMIGSEGRDEYGERYAPKDAVRRTMSGCLVSGLGRASGFAWGWVTKYTGRRDEKFVAPPWVLPVPEGFRFPRGLTQRGGMIEHPHEIVEVDDLEFARDYLIRMSVSLWDWYKNKSGKENPSFRYRLVAIPWMLARREGMRIVGDYVLTEKDELAGAKFPDSIGTGGYPITTHDSGGTLTPRGDYHRPDPPPYEIPFRSLYSVNVPNLLMAGRCVSMTHRALGSMRVQSTCALTGEAAGHAAAICSKEVLLPREYGDRLQSLGKSEL